MRLPPSKPDNLDKDGASIRVWRDSRQKLRTLAALLGKPQAVVFDELVHNALQQFYDQEERPPKG